jgi:hypothetical protein
MRLTAAIALSFTALMGCSSSDKGGTTPYAGPSAGGGAGDDGPVITGDKTWTNGTHITSPVVIDAGTTVTIEPGAIVTCDDGITITVLGQLKSTAGGAAHAKLTGTDWHGITVGEGGSLALDAVDLENAHTGIEVKAKAAAASFDNGTISGSTIPMLVDAGGKLTTSHATVVASLGTSHVLGELVASYLDYDANGYDGFTTEHDSAVLSIEDSKLHGVGVGADMIASFQGAGRIHVAYTEITRVHCAFHLERVTSLDVDHVTAQGDAFGMMMYGSLKDGTRSIKSSNFTGNFEWGIHETDDAINGPTTVTGCYFTGNGLGDVRVHTGSSIQVASNATAPVPGAKPR